MNAPFATADLTDTLPIPMIDAVPEPEKPAVEWGDFPEWLTTHDLAAIYGITYIAAEAWGRRPNLIPADMKRREFRETSNGLAHNIWLFNRDYMREHFILPKAGRPRGTTGNKYTPRKRPANGVHAAVQADS